MSSTEHFVCVRYAVGLACASSERLFGSLLNWLTIVVPLSNWNVIGHQCRAIQLFLGDHNFIWLICTKQLLHTYETDQSSPGLGCNHCLSSISSDRLSVPFLWILLILKTAKKISKSQDLSLLFISPYSPSIVLHDAKFMRWRRRRISVKELHAFFRRCAQNWCLA